MPPTGNNLSPERLVLAKGHSESHKVIDLGFT